MLYSRPDAVDELTAGGFFDCPTNFADNYGERIRGYITAPTTGSYTFWIASDDNSELWLSLDENPGNLKKIASITGSIWTGHNVWNAYPSQQSCPINLAGGKRYYIEVLHKEGTGGDNLSVGWQGPGITGDAERPIPLSRFTPLPTPKNVVSSQATTWSNSSGTWQPGSSYSWNVAMNSSGLPTTPLIDFNFATPSASNAAWKFIGSIEKYDNFSTPLETKNGKGIYSTTIYRNDVHLPIAAVANSKYDECAVYTCDHDIDNGWEKGSGCSMSVTKKHFGDSSVYVNRNYGPTKNITGFSTAKGYIFSAWVYPLDGNKISLNVEKRIGGVYSGNFGKDYTFTADKQNKWNLINVSITPAQLTGMNPGSDYLRIHVSCNPGNNTQFYVDDIRFYPKNALVTTTYYDSKWYQPILSVDANNNPSQKVEYDDFGRPVRWYKFDKNTTGLTPLQEKEYHLRSELNEGQSVQVLYPDCGGGVFYAGNKIDVSWVQSTTGTSRIKCVRPDNSIVCEIANENFSSGINVYEWEIPIAAVGDCKIQATAPDNSTDESDRIFTVRNESAITLTNIAAAGSGNHLEINWDGYDGNAGSTIKYNVLIKQEERSCVDMPPVCRWLPMSTLLNETRIEPGTTNTHSVTTNNFIGQIIPDHYQCALTITAKNDRGIVSTKMLITKVGSQYQLIPYP
jgi:hypothetical protein